MERRVINSKLLTSGWFSLGFLVLRAIGSVLYRRLPLYSENISLGSTGFGIGQHRIDPAFAAIALIISVSSISLVRKPFIPCSRQFITDASSIRLDKMSARTPEYSLLMRLRQFRPLRWGIQRVENEVAPYSK
jgi:hypothetical protein